MTRLSAPIAVALLASGVAMLAQARAAGAAEAGSSASCPATGAVAEAKGPFPLAGEQSIRLEAACDRRRMTDMLKSSAKDRRYILVADDLRASKQPGTLYRLRLGGARLGRSVEVGTINFFAARRAGVAGPPRSISFDVTATIRTLLASGWPAQGLGVAIAPSSTVAPGADASVGAIRLVAQ